MFILFYFDALPLSLFLPCHEAKELVCRLMDVDQMLRITAQDALSHAW